MESPERTDGNETSRPVLAPMDDRKWIAIMFASMLLLVGVAAVLVQRPGRVTDTHAVMSR